MLSIFIIHKLHHNNNNNFLKFLQLVITLLAIAGLHQSQETKLPKAKRGSAVGDYALLGDLNSAQAGWKGLLNKSNEITINY